MYKNVESIKIVKTLAIALMMHDFLYIEEQDLINSMYTIRLNYTLYSDHLENC